MEKIYVLGIHGQFDHYDAYTPYKAYTDEARAEKLAAYLNDKYCPPERFGHVTFHACVWEVELRASGGAT